MTATTVLFWASPICSGFGCIFYLDCPLSGCRLTCAFSWVDNLVCCVLPYLEADVLRSCCLSCVFFRVLTPATSPNSRHLIQDTSHKFKQDTSPLQDTSPKTPHPKLLMHPRHLTQDTSCTQDTSPMQGNSHKTPHTILTQDTSCTQDTSHKTSHTRHLIQETSHL